MFRTTDSTPSLSLLKTLCRYIVDHHTLPVVHSLCLSGQFHTGLGPLALYYMQKHLYPIFSTSIVNGLHSTHVYLLSISEYGHAQRKYHIFNFPCHMFVLFFYMLHLLFHMFISKIFHMLIAFVTHYVSSLQYKLQVSVLYFLSFEYQSSSPLLSDFISEVYSLCLKSRAHR